MVIVLDGLNHQKVYFLDPVHEFLRSSCLVWYFLDLLIEEQVFSTFYYFLELLPVYQTSSWPVFLQVSATINVSLTLWVPRDIDDFWVLSPSTFNDFSKWIDGLFRWLDVGKIGSVDDSDVLDYIFDKYLFFYTTFDDRVFPIENILFFNQNSDGERSVIWS